jgi:hypothetical protein
VASIILKDFTIATLCLYSLLNSPALPSERGANNIPRSHRGQLLFTRFFNYFYIYIRKYGFRYLITIH